MVANWAGCVIPEELLYHLEYDVWVRLQGDIATIGMTDIAQTRCGRLVQLSWKSLGKSVQRGRALSAIESAKWVGPFRAPLSGVIVDNNKSTFDLDVAVCNRDPYGIGWMYKIQLSNLDEVAELARGEEAYTHYKTFIDDNQLRCFRCEE